MNQDTSIKEFNKAYDFFNKGEYSEAQKILLSIIEHRSSFETEYLLGRTYAAQSAWAPSLLHLHRASLLERRHQSVIADLEWVQTKVERDMGLKMSHPSEWGATLYRYLRPEESFSLCSLFIILWLFFKYINKASFRRLSLAFILLFAILGGLAQLSKKIALVYEDTPLYSAPLSSSENILTVKSGARVRVIKESGSFYDIERSDSFRGWVPKKTLMFIYP